MIADRTAISVAESLPGPRSSLAALWAYLRDPIECLVPMMARYGDVIRFPGRPPIIMVGSPAAIRAVYAADADAFAPLAQDLGALIGERSLLLLSGADHRRARRLMGPPFAGTRVRGWGEAMVQATLRHTADWRAGSTVGVLEVAQRISLDVILDLVFGVRERAAAAALTRELLALTNGISPLIALLPALRRDFAGVGPWAGFRRRRDRVWASLGGLISARRGSRARGEPGDDLLGALVGARFDDGTAMDDVELRDQLVTLVFAGHETTAIAIAWALHALHRPDGEAALHRLTAELDALPAEASPDALAKLPWLDAVASETLRRYPLAPAPAPRRCLRPLAIPTARGEVVLPAGTGVSVGIGMVHFREDVHPEPLRFRPERFLERTFGPAELVPFGGGARRCLGAALASLELRVVVGTLLRRFRFAPGSARADRGAVRAANVGPRHGVRLPLVEVRAP